MNYRHHYHAGNFADVFKHAFLLDLVSRLQRKPAGFLYIDTHAGRGRYDLSAAGKGDSLEREPEHPLGIGRLLRAPALGDVLQRYLEAVLRFDGELGGGGRVGVRFYPGSPRLVRGALRPVDRMHLCEKHPEEFELLDVEMGAMPRVSLHPVDGYGALRAALPSKERRALVLIDPPFEDAEEFHHVYDAIAEGLRRLPSAVVAIWYPLTERAGVGPFVEALQRDCAAPVMQAQLSVVGPGSSLRMRGCGLLVVNPPWQLEDSWKPALIEMTSLLAQGPGASSELRWLVPER